MTDDLVRRAEAKAELECRKCADNCQYFIAKYGYIKDEDSGEMVPFQLWPGQLIALGAFLVQRLILVLKARQLGLTWLALWYGLQRMLFRAGFSLIAMSKSDNEAKKLIERLDLMLRSLPPWMVRRHDEAPPGWPGPTWEKTTHTVTIHHPGKLDSTAEALAAGQEAGRSFTASLLLIDEWAFQQWARQIWTAAFPIVNRPTGGQVIGLSTMSLGTLFAELCRGALEGANKFKLVFLGWFEDPRRTQEWYDDSARALPDTIKQEYPATIEEAFEGKTGRVVPEYTGSVHYIACPDDLLKHPDWYEWAWYIDPAPDSPTAMTLWAFAKGGTCYAVAEVYSPGGRVTEIVAEAWQVQQRVGCKVKHRVIDPASQAAKSEGMSSDYTLYREAWAKYDQAPLLPANNAQGTDRLRERLAVHTDPDGRQHTGLYVCQPDARTPGCPHLHAQMRDLTWKPQRADGTWPGDWGGEDHAFDTARYMSNDRPEWKMTPTGGPGDVEPSDPAAREQWMRKKATEALWEHVKQKQQPKSDEMGGIW